MGEPRIRRTFASVGHERGQVVENEKVHAIELKLKGLLPFNAAEIDSNFAVVGGKDTQSVIRHVGTKPRQYRIQSRLKVGRGHLAIEDKHATRTRRFPPQKRASARNSHANRKPKPGLADSSRSIEHGQTFFWENGTEQHPPCWNFKSKKVFDADRTKRHDSVTAIGNAAADAGCPAHEVIRNAQHFGDERNYRGPTMRPAPSRVSLSADATGPRVEL